MYKMKQLVKKLYRSYKDFFPADLWALLIMILMFVILGIIFLV